jgi:Arc/MetJ family transcription regulator
MRTKLAIEDDLLATAQHLTGIMGKAPLVREAVKAMISRESARCLARLGGPEPLLKAPPRRRQRAK